jgi:signal transduction histidine kinase/sensor domain CHASE-containing protein
MQSKAIPKNVALLVLFAVLAATLALFAGLFFMADRQDKQALSAERKMLEGGLSAMQSTLSELANDYSWWDDLHNAVLNRTDSWYDSNLGTAVHPNNILDYLAIFDSNVKPIVAWNASAEGRSSVVEINPDLLQDIQQIIKSKPEGRIPATIFFSQLNNEVVMFALARVFPPDETLIKNAKEQPYLLAAYKLKPERISKLGQQFLVGSLVLGDPEKAPAHAIALMSPRGKALGNFQWTPSTPGSDALKTSVVPIGMITALLLAGALSLSRMAHKQALSLSKSEASAKAAADHAQEQLLASAKLATLGKLTSTVAHEIRNPLGSVRTSAYVLSKKLGNNPDYASQFNRIEKGITRCDHIINQLLDYSRTKEAQVQDVELDSWISQVLQEEAVLLPPDLNLVCELGVGPEVAAFDPERLRRVMVNLLSNASHAMQNAAQKNPNKKALLEIRIETKKTARGYEIALADNGPGIPAEHLTTIFEPFFTTKSFGTGLGLPACVNIMENHRGGLDVSSEVGKGTRFTAWFPDDLAVKEAA